MQQFVNKPGVILPVMPELNVPAKNVSTSASRNTGVHRRASMRCHWVCACCSEASSLASTSSTSSCTPTVVLCKSQENEVVCCLGCSLE